MPSRLALSFAAIAMVGSVLFAGGAATAQDFSPSPEPPPEEESSPKPQSSVFEGDEQPPEDSEVPGVIAALSASPLSGPAPLAVTLDGSGSQGSISSYSLDFGDGTAPVSGKGQPVATTHTYATNGSYTAVLTVNGSDFTDSASATITVADEEATPTVSPTGTVGPVNPPGTADPDDSTTDEDENGIFPGNGGGDTTTAAQQAAVTNDERSILVSSVPTAGDVSLAPKLLATSALLALLLVLLVGFPADMFNATLLEHYEEVSGWFNWSWLNHLRGWVSGLPAGVVLPAFAAGGALLYSLLEPHFGLDRGSLALLTGLFLSFLIVSLVYDVARSRYIKRHFDVTSTIRAQMVGLFVGLILVLLSRAAGFHPGYIYGVFTALVFRGALNDKEDGKALAVVSVVLGVIAVAAWLLWIPVQEMAVEEGASFLVLALDALLADLWIIGLGFIVFGLVPLRFFYGEKVKAWSFRGWLAIYGVGMFVFVHALLLPEEGFYEHSAETSLRSVLVLFVGFALFSLMFWGYFRYRHLWRGTKAETT